MHRIPLHLSTPSVSWERSLPEYVLFERTLNTGNMDETIAFMHVLDDEADFYKSQCYGIAEDMFAKAKSCILSSNATSFSEGMFLINSIILRTPKDSSILACALKIRGHLLYYDCSFEFASNDYKMFLEVNRFKESPLDETCEVVGNLVVCMYMKRQLVKAKMYCRLYQKYKAKLLPEVLQKSCFVQIESRIANFMNELNDSGSIIPSISDTGAYYSINKNAVAANYENKIGFSMYAKMDIHKTDVIFVEAPILQSLNAPFVICEVCYRLSQQQIYTCLECRYKSYCSLDCLEKDKIIHTDECLGFKQLTLIILDANGIYRIFRSVIENLHKQIFNQKIFRKKKMAKEIWPCLLKAVNDIKLDENNNSLSFIKTTPQYRRLLDKQYSTLVATAFRLAVFIDTKTKLIEQFFQKLTISAKQKLILVGSLLMRIHCNILLNTFDFEIGLDDNMKELQADVEQSTTLISKNKSNYNKCDKNLNEHFKVNMQTDIWQHSLDILQSTQCNNSHIITNTSPTKHHTQLCSQIHRILSIYKDNIAALYFNPEQIQTVMFGPTAGQRINEVLVSAMCARLTEMTDVQRCLFLKRFARLFHNHYTEYFMQMLEVQVHQVLSLYSPKLRQFQHSCNPNVEIIILDNGVIMAKSLRDIKKGEELCVSYKAHHMHHMGTDRHMFLKRFNIDCQCVYCKINHMDDPVNIRQGIYCECCKDIEITPEHGKCPKCHVHYSNLLNKYRTVINIFEYELTSKLKSHDENAVELNEREIYILQHIIYSYAKKYFVPQNEYRIRSELRYARYLALKNFAQHAYNLIMEIRGNILQSYAEHFIWFTYYADIFLAIKIILCYNVEQGLYTISSKMLMQLCDLGLYIVKGQVDVIDFYEVFNKKCPYVLDDLSLLLKWKDKIVCHRVLSLAKLLNNSKAQKRALHKISL